MPETDPLVERLTLAEGRLKDVENALVKINYALFGVRGDNGLFGSLEKLAAEQKKLNDRLDQKDEKDEKQWSALQWKFIAGLAAIVMMLLPILIVTVAQ